MFYGTRYDRRALRAYMCDRLVLTMVNKNIIISKDFEKKETGAVLLNAKGR